MDRNAFHRPPNPSTDPDYVARHGSLSTSVLSDHNVVYPPNLQFSGDKLVLQCNLSVSMSDSQRETAEMRSSV